MGAWIETMRPFFDLYLTLSHPTWVRGLKLARKSGTTYYLLVAPYVGAWIETAVVSVNFVLLHVAPYVGAWIET